MIFPDFKHAIGRASGTLRQLAQTVHTKQWQGIDISKRPEAQMKEVLDWYFKVPLVGYQKNQDLLRDHVKPNLPWADDHFEERVCGRPINPGETWKTWPWANSANEFRDEKGRFEVNYMERFWAGGSFDDTPAPGVNVSHLTGIRGRPYGDLGSIVKLLVKDPTTRQAYLPIYFPEDTGAGGRVPCSLGYFWIQRHGYLHTHYAIRSCDFLRHFRDDIYLAVRLSMWLRDQLALQAPDEWNRVQLGHFSMWIGSLHLFINDYRKLFG